MLQSLDPGLYLFLLLILYLIQLIPSLFTIIPTLININSH